MSTPDQEGIGSTENSNIIGAFKDPTLLTRIVQGLLVTTILLEIVSIIFGGIEYSLINSIENGSFNSESELLQSIRASDIRQGILAIIQIGLYILQGIFILIWIRRANINIRKLGAKNIEASPNWSIGSYFVPIVNLFMPYIAMKEIYFASISPSSWSKEESSNLLVCWWFLWIISFFIGRAIIKLSMGSNASLSALDLNMLTQVANIVYIALCSVFSCIVYNIYQSQMRHYKAASSKLPA